MSRKFSRFKQTRKGRSGWLPLLAVLLLVLLLSGSPPTTLAGDNGGDTLDFDGVDDSVQAVGYTGVTGANDRTVEAWVRGTGTDDVIFDWGQQVNTNKWTVRVNGDGTLRAEVSGGFKFGTTPINDGQWHHIAVVWANDGTPDIADALLYVDGQLETVGGVIGQTVNTSSVEDVHVGSSYWSNDYAGQIENARIWSVARTQAQIQASMFGDPADTTGLELSYKFDDGTGSSTVTDSSGNGRTGTLFNMDPATDWVVSTAPIGDATVNSQTDITGLWASNNPATSTGLQIANNSFFNDVGDDIVFGHNNQSGTTTADTPPGVTSRVSRIYYCDLNDQNSNGGTVDLTFDLNDTGGAPVINDPTRYRLLERAGTSGDFSVIVGAATSVSTINDTVTFTGVSSADVCSYITLGVGAPFNLIVDRADDPDPTTAQACDGATANDCSLRGAILTANADTANAYTITFDPALDGVPITLSIAGAGSNDNLTGDLNITDDLTIQGNGARQTIIDGAGIDRVFNIGFVGTVNLNDLTIQGGVLGFAASAGGGLLVTNGATVTVNDSTIDNNSVDRGGGIYNENSILTINNSTISNNSANTDGGGIYLIASGGGSATLTMSNSTVSNNSATDDGGGLFGFGGVGNPVTADITFSTIAANTADADTSGVGDGGGLYDGSGVGVTFNLDNSILADNSANAGPECNAVESQDFNLIETSAGCTIGGTTTNNQSGDPALAALADNGGPTDTHLPGSGSIVLDAADNTTCSAAPVNNLDQRGVSRPLDGDGDTTPTCDIGAVEFVPAVAGGSAGGLGPGGVGHTDMSTSLELWLRSDRGVYSDDACSTVAGNGSDVGCWEDQSGHGYAYTQATAGNRPTFVTGSQNGQPDIQFNGTSDRLTSGAVLAAGDDTFSYFAAWASTGTGNFQVLFEQNNTSVQAGERAAFLITPNFPPQEYGFNGQSNDFHDALPFVNGQYQVSTIVLDGTGASNVHVYGEGASNTGTINMGTQNVSTAGGTAVGYKIPSNSEFFNGQTSEIIVFSDDLIDVTRILVENYLGAKYDRPIIMDVYDGDTGANGDFDLDVAGIGRTGGNSHTQAHSAGIIVIDQGFLQDNGDWLLFGHRNAAPGNTTADLPSSGDWSSAPNPTRWVRHWYFHRTDVGTTGGTVDLIFDLDEGGMGDPNPPSTPVDNYRLLGRSGATGAFDDITDSSGATVVINGNQIQFLGVDVTVLGSNFTVGTLDFEDSPTALTLLGVEVGGGQTTAVVLTLVVLLFGSLTLWWVGRRETTG